MNHISLSKYDRNPVSDRLLDLSQTLVGHPRPQLDGIDSDLTKQIIDQWHVESTVLRKVFCGESIKDVIPAMVRKTLVQGDSVIIHTTYGGGYGAMLVEDSNEITIDNQGVATMAGTPPIQPMSYSLLRFERGNRFRGKSAFASIDSALGDVDEIKANYRQAIRVSSKVALVMSTDSSPQTPVEELGLFPQSNNDSQVPQSVAAQMAPAGGVATLRRGEKLDILGDDRPRPEVAAFLESCKAEIAAAFGLPPEIAFDLSSLKGAGNRLRTAECNKCIEDKRVRIDEVLSQIFARWAIDRFIIPNNIKDAAIIRAITRPVWVWTEAITIDERYSTQSTIDLVDAGLLSRREVFSAYGLDWESETIQIAKERQLIKSLETNNDITVNE